VHVLENYSNCNTEFVFVRERVSYTYLAVVETDTYMVAATKLFIIILSTVNVNLN
jgi:polysaccharide pyruvyl transferase WcaK-like protein